MTVAESLQPLFDSQRAAFARGAPDYHRRIHALTALRDIMRARQSVIVGAISADFGGRAAEETLLLELLPLYDQIQHACRHLKRWMRRQPVRGTWFLQPSRAFVQYQPLGVVGVIGAWNYPLLLTLGPVLDALAAGNHVMLKPSEITSRTADVIAAMIADTFPPAYVTCVTGGPDIASAFSSLPFDHLFFTGSTRVGTLVMQAAARHLTPVTLELGGKSPALVHEHFPLARAAERILVGKLFNAGQTCVAPDYVLLCEGLEAAFEAEARRVVSTLYPKLVDTGDYTRIINPHHYDRLQHAVRDAADHGARIVELNPANEQVTVDNKVLLPTLVFVPRDDAARDGMIVMRDEIFGPLLPIVSYRTLDDAIAYINARPRPLAFYYFDEDRRRIDDVLRRTLSGGVLINDCVIHLGQHHLPFGGVGPSGMGHYHGFDGFVTFSKKRGVMVQRRWAPTMMARPPYHDRLRAIIEIVLKLTRW